MRTTNMMMWLSVATLALLAGVVLPAVAAPYVVLPDGRKMLGTQVKGTKDGKIVLTTANGQMEFPKGTRVFVDEPADYAKAAKLLQDKQYDEAAGLLKRIAADYRYLEWGSKAQKLLGQAYIGAKQFKDAVQAYEDLLAENPEVKTDGDFQAGYMQALAGAGDTGKLPALLEQIIATGPRDAAAQAQIVRGNLRLKAGDTEDALYDFLRTADFFRESAEVQPAALYGVGAAYEALGDATHAADYFAQVIKDYPNSASAAQARARIKVK